MIAEGPSLELLAWCLCVLGLGFGVYLGGRGLADPHWAQKVARLKPDERGGGFAEFRAVYGGLFLGLHLVALMLALAWILRGGGVVGTTAIGAIAVISAAWGGAGAGRTISIMRDPGVQTPFNRLSVLVEIVMALLIGAPWFFWMAGLS